MNTAIQILILAVMICQILLFGYALIRLKSSISTLKKTLLAYFQPKGDQQSEFAQFVGLFAKLVGDSIVASVKGYLMSLNSAAVRGDAAEARQGLSENPALAGLLTFAPGLSKKLAKNPAMAALAANLMQRFAPTGGNAPSNNGGNHSSGDFNKI